MRTSRIFFQNYFDLYAEEKRSLNGKDRLTDTNARKLKMSKNTAHSHLKKAVRILSLAVLTICCLPAMASAQSQTDGKIYAVYSVDFNGITLGKFKFRSDVSEKQYSMSGNSKFTFLNGLLFKWKGNVHSSGALTKTGPLPTKFSYSSKANGKVNSVNMRFKNNVVSEVVRRPRKKPSKKKIPLIPAHLENVVDPMSALMLLTDPKHINGSPQDFCNRHMSIFDGQQRFDLKLTFKRKSSVKQKPGSGFSTTAYVCKVKYRPIAGYKPNKSGIKYMAKSNDIEVWLVPVRKAKMLIPHKIVLPTVAGYATATVQKFQIDQPGKARLAFNAY